MNATTTRARIGITGKVKSSYPSATGTVTLGFPDADMNLTANKPYSLRLIMANGGIYGLDLDDPGTTTVGTTGWTAGTAQVETATAAGSITTSGNATVTVTAAGMTGSPKAISVAVLSGDTAAQWAAKVRTALAADADVSAMFEVGGTTTAIVLTRKPTHTFTVPDGSGGTTSLYIYAANDGTLNIALADDTSAGITEAATSANTTAGVASAGVKLYGGGMGNFEGVEELDALDSIAGLFLYLATGEVIYENVNASEIGTMDAASGAACRMFLNSGAEAAAVASPTAFEFTCATAPADLTIHVFAQKD